MQSPLLFSVFNQNNDPLATTACMHKDTSATPLYLQHRSLEIIQLIEVPAPPRVQRQPSTIASSSAASSSSSYISSSTSGTHEEESVASSYCSSDEGDADVFVPDDTYKTRLSRVLAWRESSAQVPGGSQPLPPAPAIPAPLKRKAETEDPGADDDTASHSSKRSRSSTSRLRTPRSKRRFSEHSCPACDSSFSTRQSLRQHGREAARSDACREAVEYGFEQ